MRHCHAAGMLGIVVLKKEVSCTLTPVEGSRFLLLAFDGDFDSNLHRSSVSSQDDGKNLCHPEFARDLFSAPT